MNGTTKTVLIVDDDPINIQVINEYLLDQSYHPLEVLNANTAQLALKIAGRIKPDIIITDWEMPGMNGIEFTKQLKADPETLDIPVIMASGIMLTSKNLDEALAAGAVDYIRKPIDPIELIARLRTAIEMSDYIRELHYRNEVIENQRAHIMEQEIKELRQENAYKQRDLATNIGYLTQLQQEKILFTEQLSKLRPYLNKEGKQQLEELVQGSLHAPDQPTLLEVEASFVDINRDFFMALEQRAPDITRNEKLICAYLKMNLSITEIAKLTGKNANALHVSLSRVRQKLGSDTTTDLKQFLTELTAEV